MFAFDTASFPIGIDIGAQSVRLLQFKKAADGLALQAACRVDLDPAAQPTPFIAALRQALDSQGFSGKQVVLALPAASVHARSVRLPQMPDSDLGQALRWEAKDRFGFDVGGGGPDDGELVWFRAGEVRRGTEIKDELLLFGINAETLNAYIRPLVEEGLKIAALDLAPCAAYRAVERSWPGMKKGTNALLDLGHNGSQFLVTHDGELVFYKQIEIGGRIVNEAIAAKLGITVAEAAQMRSRLTHDASVAQEAAPLNQALRDAMRVPLEELAREIDMCMRYYVVTFRGARPEAIGLAGRQAACPQTREILAAALGLKVEEVQPLRGVQDLGGAARPDRSSEWAVAAGLALYPVGRAALPRQTEAAA